MHDTIKDTDSVLNSVAVIIKRSLKQLNTNSEIRPEMSLIKDLDLDSLRMVDLVLDIEDHFQVRIMEAEIQSVFTVRDLASLVEHKLKEQ